MNKKCLTRVGGSNPSTPTKWQKGQKPENAN